MTLSVTSATSRTSDLKHGIIAVILWQRRLVPRHEAAAPQAQREGEGGTCHLRILSLHSRWVVHDSRTGDVLMSNIRELTTTIETYGEVHIVAGHSHLPYQCVQQCLRFVVGEHGPHVRRQSKQRDRCVRTFRS